ncbi:hypothetical protein [Kribbella sp. VKM Ac-2568]|uniref:DUF7144 family membrane protein n=1 Tax=Kribbella sp. VKM Ac-2568 TaxID=2512219 RepID=UPI0010E041FA|nr:hypothetical protein [Kribbella sp. VKM Ac-2568]TCM40395.1 hypothetical protein EV648_113218 [Kribbella sp. VKM Ac-2568]
MSDTSDGSPAARHLPPQAATGRSDPEPTGWVGWIVFAGIMMIVVGGLHIFQGLVALFDDDYYQVGNNGLTIHLDYNAWGWTHVIFGVLVCAAAIGLLAGQLWGRIAGVVLAVLSILVNVAFLAAYPIWSTIVIAIDILVIWALTVHGREVRSSNAGW